jgi:DNA-binding MarR family transcriptional regulator
MRSKDLQRRPSAIARAWTAARRRAHTDERRILCFATPTGSAAAAAAAGAVDEAFRTTLRRLHAKERARLHVLMARAMG